MKEYHLGELLTDLQKNYEEQPLFLLPEGKGSKAVDYGTFLSDVKAGAKWGMEFPHQRIALLGYNCYEWVITALSLLLAGKTLIFPDVNLNDQELDALLRYTDTECVLMQEDLMGDLSYFVEQYPAAPFLCGTDAACEDKTEDSMLPDLGGEFICFTSGTTKSSKGVVISANNLAKHFCVGRGKMLGDKGDRYFVPAPLFHIYPFTSLFHIMQKGGTICLGTEPRYIKREVSLFQPQIAILVPSMIDFLFRKTETSWGIQGVLIAGSRCRKELSNLLIERGITVLNCYGSSESIGAIAYSKPDGDVERLYPISSAQFCTNEEGEIGVVLASHMDGYYKREADTEAVLGGDLLWTGDRGILYEDGSIEIQGRVRDMIVLENGEKLHAEDTDEVLASLTGIKEVCVIYRPEFGLTAVFGMVKAEDQVVVGQKIRRYNRTHDPKQRMEHIWFRETALPHTSTGKLKRFDLEEAYLKLQKKDVYE